MSSEGRLQRPRPVRVDDLVARAKRAPSEADPGRWGWQITTRAEGRDVHLAYGRWTSREVARELARRVAAGDYRRAPAVGTLDELLLAWAQDQAARPDLAPLTREAAVHAARSVAAQGGELLLDRMRAADVEAVQRAMLRSGLAASTVRHRIAVLYRAWAWARARGLAPDRDAPRVPPPRAGRPVYCRHTPTHREIERTLEAMPPGPWVGVLRLLWLTGARIGGALGLRWGDVDVGGGMLTIRGDAGRRAGKGAPVAIPMSPAVRELLEELLEARRAQAPAARELVFGFDHARPACEVRRRLRLACERAGVRRWTPHGLRRRAVRDMIAAGVDVTTAASITGHSVRTMLLHYTEAQAADRERAAATLGPPAVGAQIIAFGRKGTG